MRLPVAKSKVTLDEEHILNMADKWSTQLGEGTDKSRFEIFIEEDGIPNAYLKMTGTEIFNYTVAIIKMTLEVVNTHGEFHG